jgi:membrane-associated phospholipid phosphatase
MRIVLVLAILFSSLIGSARLSLKAHVPQQIYAGFVLGFALMFVVMNFPLVHF